MNDVMHGLLSSSVPLRRQAQAALQAQQWAQAMESLNVLAAMEPDDPWCQQWRLVVALALGQAELAVSVGQTALQALPPDAVQQRADVAFNLGQAHSLLGQSAAAMAAFDQALSWQPGHPQALLARAKALAQMSYHGQAGKPVEQALLSDPRNLQVLAEMAMGLLKAGAVARALQAYMQHERAKPAAPFVACMVVFLRRQLADWSWPDLPVSADEARLLSEAMADGCVPELELLEHRAWQGMPAIEPFSGLVLYDEPALHRHVAKQFLQRMHPPVPLQELAAPRVAAPASAPGALVKVAYVSNEFCEHATSHLLAGVLARHHPGRVQVLLLSYAPLPQGKPDAMQQRLQTMGHTWVDVHGWSDAQVAQWCRAQGVDVAVDLKGLTRDGRPGIFAHRAAPVQVNWLGYPGTLPAPYYDWVLADAQVLPPELELHFAERVWRLPHSYQPNDPGRVIDPTPQHRADHGLPESGVVLVCFNQVFKLTPAVWAMWMRLLQARPEAVLWLLAGAPEAHEHLRTHAMAAGVAPERLVFAPKLPQAQHLARLRLADLSLDTLPYNAHTTASDALWAGVPHVACSGKSFAARVGASVLTAAGMPELIAHGLADYEALALRLLRNDAERAALRAKLAEQRRTAALWDAAGFASALEDAFEGMVARKFAEN